MWKSAFKYKNPRDSAYINEPVTESEPLPGFVVNSYVFITYRLQITPEALRAIKKTRLILEKAVES